MFRVLDDARHTPQPTPAPPSDPSSGECFTERQRALKEQVPFICDLLFTEQDPRLSSQLFSALERIEPEPLKYAPVLASLLNHPSPEMRARAAEAMAEIPLDKADYLPILFSAMHRERNEPAREAMRSAVNSLGSKDLYALGNYYENLRFSAYAKKADLKDFSGTGALRPDQVHRALVQLHLDPDQDVRKCSSACLYQSIPHLDDRQKAGLLLDIVYSLSDPGKLNTYVTGDLLYAAERLGQDAREITPLLAKLFDNPDGVIATNAALTALWLNPGEQRATEVLRAALSNRHSTEVVIDPPQPTPTLDRPVDFGPFYQFIESVIGPGADTSELEALEYSMHEARDNILEAYERQIAELADRMRKASRELSDWSRELLVMKVANRLDRIGEETSAVLLASLMSIMEDPDEPLRVRKAAAAYPCFNQTGNSVMAGRFLAVALDDSSPCELRARACRSLVHLERLSEPEYRRIAYELEGLVKSEPDPLVQGAAELSLKNLRFFHDNPSARYSFLFDKEGNLHPAIKSRLRDMISPD